MLDKNYWKVSRELGKKIIKKMESTEINLTEGVIETLRTNGYTYHTSLDEYLGLAETKAD